MPKRKGRINKHKPTRWDKEAIEKSLLDVSCGESIRKTAAKFGMSESSLRWRKKKLESGETSIGSGRKNTLSKEEEKALAKCVT